MFNSHFLTIKLNLMNKMNLNLFQLSGVVKLKAVAFALLFMMGMGTVSAQYMEPNEALVAIKGEVSELLDQEANTTNESVLATIRFKKSYYLNVFQRIDDGNTVDAAIHTNLPQGMAVENNGFFTVDVPADFRTRVSDLVEEAEALLSE